MFRVNPLKINLVWFSLFFLLFITNCKDKQSKPEEVETIDTKQTNMTENSTKSKLPSILCYGNSLTAGYGISEDEAWPALLQNRLDSMGLEYKVINAGLSGETSSGGLNRLDWVLRQAVDIFILELGANDMLRGLDVNKTEENLNGILTQVHAKYPNCKIIVAGMLSPPNMGQEYEQKFNAIFPKLATNHNGKLIPFFLDKVAGVENLNLPDGKHPNAEGQKVVLENVWSQLQPLLIK